MVVVMCVGLTTVDVIQQVAEFPGPGDKVQSSGVHLAPGGPAANAASAVVALGHESVLLTALGRDGFGRFAAAGLAERGVEFHDLAPDSRISLSMVAVRERDGERTVISRNAAEVALQATVDAVTPFVLRSDVLLLDGHLGQLALMAANVAK